MNLHEYVTLNTTIVDALGTVEADIDVVFFKVMVNEEATPEGLRPLLNYRGVTHSTRIELLDGHVHRYVEIGQWLGDEKLALRLMALGAHLDLWRLITPRDLSKTDDPDALMAMALSGMVCIVKERAA